MWRERILAALFLRNNAASDEAVRERLDDLRPLHLGMRLAIVLLAIAAIVGERAAVLSPLGACAAAFAILHEWHVSFVRAASTARDLERRLLIAGVVMAAWALATLEVAALPLPFGFLPLAVILAGFSLMLGTRGLTTLVAGATSAAVALAAYHGMVLTVPGAEDDQAAWAPAVARILVFAGFAAFSFLGQRRLRRARAEMRAVVEDLRVAEGRLSESHTELERMNHDLAVEAEREALLNRVAEVLLHKDHHALQMAMRLAVPAMGATEIAIVDAPRGSHRAVVVAHVRAEGLQDERASDRLDSVLLAAHAMIADRVHAMVMGEGGESPLSLATVQAGITSIMIVPMRHGPARPGAMVVTSSSGVAWSAADAELAERLAAAFTGRMQSDALFDMQARRIRELAGLREIAGIVQATVDTDRLLSGFARALHGLTPFEAVYVARLDPDGMLFPVVQLDAEGRTVDTPPAPASERSQDAAHAWFGLRDATVWSTDRGPSPSFYHPGGRAPVVVPLRPKGQVLGVVVVTPAASMAAEEVALLGQAVAQLALAIDSLALYRQATVRAARIQVLGNLARIVGSVLDLRDEFATFAEEVRWLIPYDRAMILRIDADRGIAQPYVAYPANTDLLAAREILSTSLARIAYEASQAVVLTRDDARAAGCDWSLFDDATELAMVPIMRDDACIAVFAVAHSDTRLYAADEVGALDEIARLLAVSIERVELFQRAEHNATHDLLTGLANYRGLQERIAEVRLGITDPGATTVVMVDMDDLKVINDSLGHSVGDDVVKAVGQAMRDACRAEDFVARVGGDEFVLVMEGVDAEAGALVAERIHATLRNTPVTIHGVERGIRVSAGVAAAPRDAESMADLLQVADATMYEAKAAGGGRTAIADPTRSRQTQALRGRPDRLVETIVRAATSGASIEEREAIALAQRYALETASRVGLPAPESEVLKMLVARHAGPRLVEPRLSLDRTLAFIALDGLAVEWATRAGESAAVAQILIAASTDLAWLQMPPPAGAGWDLDEAIRRLAAGREGLLDSVLLRELSTVARGGAEVREDKQQQRSAAA